MAVSLGTYSSSTNKQDLAYARSTRREAALRPSPCLPLRTLRSTSRQCVCSYAQIFVFFPDDVKVGMKHIRTLAERMRSEGVQRAIMVAPVSVVSM